MPDEFTEVYREHKTPIWRQVRARPPSDRDAEDVTSNVFEKAMSSWRDCDAGRGSLGAWLTGTARHTVADWWRVHGGEVPASDVVVDGPGEDDSEGTVLRREGADDVSRHPGLLTPREREAVALRFGSELTSEEIGAGAGRVGRGGPAGGRVRGARGRVHLVADDGQQVHAECVDVHVDGGEGLGRVGVQQDAALAGHGGDLGQRLHGPDLVVGMHHRHEDRARLDGAGEVAGVQAPVGADGHAGDPETVRGELVTGGHRGGVLDGGGDDVVAPPGGTQRVGGTGQGEVGCSRCRRR
jgi:RNA polymerase sigma factor (sigma-70 family)